MVRFFFFFVCAGSPWLLWGAFWLWERELLSHWCSGFCCGSSLLEAGLQASVVWLTGLVAPRHMGSSWTRGRIGVFCKARWILDHQTPREALFFSLYTDTQIATSLAESHGCLLAFGDCVHEKCTPRSTFLCSQILQSARKMVCVGAGGGS